MPIVKLLAYLSNKKLINNNNSYEIKHPILDGKAGTEHYSNKFEIIKNIINKI